MTLRHRPGRASGFTMIELMVTVAILAILTALPLISLSGSRADRQRDALNATSRDLASWLERVRRRASLGLTSGCSVTISSGALAADAAIATVNPSDCLPADPVLRLDGEVATLLPDLSLSMPAGSVVFTASVTTTPAAYPGVEIGFSSAGANLRRCLSLSNGSGQVRLGAASDSSGTCTYGGPL